MNLLGRFIRFLVVSAFKLLLSLIAVIVRFVVLPILRSALRVLRGLVFTSLVATVNGPRQFTDRLASEWTLRVLDLGIQRDNVDQIYVLCRFLVGSRIVLGWVVAILFTVAVLRVVYGLFHLIRWNPGGNRMSIFPPFVDGGREKMGRHSIITEDNVLQAVRMFRWVTRSVLVMFFGGANKRIKALEKLLPKLEREGKLAVDWHRGEKVYSMPRKKKVKPVSMDHEIVCAEILSLLWRCRMEEGEIFPERAFRGFGIVPEGGIRYSEKRNTMLIFEYCTRSNFTHGGVMKSKITRYKKYLSAIEARVKRSVTVLFVIDIERYKVREFVGRIRRILDEPVFSDYAGSSQYPFFFTDYQTFKSVPVGKALIAQIYFWQNGKEWRLTDND